MQGVDESFARTFGNYVLHGINEVVLPESVSWYPQTVGWTILLGLVLLFLLFKALVQLLRWYRNRYRTEGLKRLQRLSVASDRIEAVRGVPIVLKAVALQAYPRSEIARLSGSAWIEFLNSVTERVSFNPAQAKFLQRVSYQVLSYNDIDDASFEELIEQSIYWVKHHKAGSQSDIEVIVSSFRGAR